MAVGVGAHNEGNEHNIGMCLKDARRPLSLNNATTETWRKTGVRHCRRHGKVCFQMPAGGSVLFNGKLFTIWRSIVTLARSFQCDDGGGSRWIVSGKDQDVGKWK